MEAKRRKLLPLATDIENVKQEGKLGDKDLLFIMGLSNLICIDLNRLRNDSHHVNSKCTLPNAPTIFDFDQCLTLTQVISSSSSSDQYTLPNAPTLFNIDLCGNLSLGSFVLHNKLFILGGSIPYEKAVEDVRRKLFSRKHPFPLHVYETKFDSSKLNADPEDVLFRSPRLPALNHPKPLPIVEIIGNKVYILNTYFHGLDSHFESLDLDAPLSWTTIENPPFLDFMGDRAVVLSHFVVGLRLYLIVSKGVYAESRRHIYYFDTKTDSWALDTSIPSHINKIPVERMLLGKSTTVDGLEPNSVLLSLECLCGRDSRQLFATLVTNLGQPLCYQDIFDSVFADILPPSGFDDVSAGVFCVGDRPNRGDELNSGGKLYCALIMGIDSRNDEFLCMSFFELFGAGASVNEPLVKETEFLRVKVQEKFICRLDAWYLIISAAFLF